MISSDEDPAPRKPAPANKSKAKPAQSKAGLVNGTTHAKPKGKAKQDAPARHASDSMVVDDVQAEESDAVPPPRATKSRSTSKPSPPNDGGLVARREKRELESLKRENERLRKRLDDVFTFLYYHSFNNGTESLGLDPG